MLVAIACGDSGQEDRDDCFNLLNSIYQLQTYRYTLDEAVNALAIGTFTVSDVQRTLRYCNTLAETLKYSTTACFSASVIRVACLFCCFCEGFARG